MKLAPLALLALTLPALASEGVTNGIYKGPGVRSSLVEVRARPSYGEYEMRVTDEQGRRTNWRICTPEFDGGVAEGPNMTPTGVDENGDATTGETHRVHNGKLQVKIDGKWTRLVPAQGKADAEGMEVHFGPGQGSGSVP